MIKTLCVKNWKNSLEQAIPDEKVGIKIAPLTQHADFSMYITEVPVGGKVGSHYHQKGIEIYQILSGEGVMHTGVFDLAGNRTVESTPVGAGDFFNIEPGVAHQLENKGKQPLILVFGCPPTHLNEDRIMVGDLTQ